MSAFERRSEAACKAAAARTPEQWSAAAVLRWSRVPDSQRWRYGLGALPRARRCEIARKGALARNAGVRRGARSVPYQVPRLGVVVDVVQLSLPW